MPRSVTLVAVLLAGLLSCASSQPQIIAEANSHPWFDTDFETVLGAARDVARETYHRVEVLPRDGVVKTDWEPVEDRATGEWVQRGSIRVRTKTRVFMRIDISVVGPRPFEVRVAGYASSFTQGNAVPSPLTGGDLPTWVGPRVDSVRAAIYRRLQPYAAPTRASPSTTR